jgi:hypothetical protein
MYSVACGGTRKRYFHAVYTYLCDASAHNRTRQEFLFGVSGMTCDMRCVAAPPPRPPPGSHTLHTPAPPTVAPTAERRLCAVLQLVDKTHDTARYLPPRAPSKKRPAAAAGDDPPLPEVAVPLALGSDGTPRFMFTPSDEELAAIVARRIGDVVSLCLAQAVAASTNMGTTSKRKGMVVAPTNAAVGPVVESGANAPVPVGGVAGAGAISGGLYSGVVPQRGGALGLGLLDRVDAARADLDDLETVVAVPGMGEREVDPEHMRRGRKGQKQTSDGSHAIHGAAKDPADDDDTAIVPAPAGGSRPSMASSASASASSSSQVARNPYAVRTLPLHSITDRLQWRARSLALSGPIKSLTASNPASGPASVPPTALLNVLRGGTDSAPPEANGAVAPVPPPAFDSTGPGVPPAALLAAPEAVHVYVRACVVLGRHPVTPDAASPAARLMGRFNAHERV